MKLVHLFLPAMTSVMFAIGACSEVSEVALTQQPGTQQPGTLQPGSQQSGSQEQAEQQTGIAMKVFKSPTCGCCNDWIEHVSEHGYELEGAHPYDLDETKLLLGVAPQYQSCHTALTEDGFVFEGHVPARHIKQFLAERHEDAVGLAVPGMPTGSPGMEMGTRFDPYQVLLLKKDGSAEVYADIRSPAMQY